MKIASKVLGLLMIASIVAGCNNKNSAPLVLSLDLSDAIALFNGNNCTPDYTDGPGGFGLYKTDENGVTKRVHVKTKSSDDDKYFYQKAIHTEFLEVSDEYFYARLGTFDINSNYFVNKKTGEAYRIEGNYHYSRYSYWWDSTNPIRDFSKDNNGNFYSCAYDYKLKHDVLAKFTIVKNKVKVTTVGKIAEDNNDCYYFNDYAADKDGNIAYRGLVNTAYNWYFVTADNKVIPIDNKKAVWVGYDGAIYAYKDQDIEKITYDKATDVLSTTVVRSYPELGSLDLVNNKLLYIDKTQQIYAYGTSKDYDFVLYQIYGENALEKPVSFSTDVLSYTTARSNYFIQNYGYGYSNIDCDEDTIYVNAYDGESFVINKLDTTKNLELSQVKYSVEYNDGTRFLNNKKMLIFYWGYNPINTPEGKSTAAMSVGVLDVNTGTLSKQDTFVTGNSDRSSVVNLKSYK